MLFEVVTTASDKADYEAGPDCPVPARRHPGYGVGPAAKVTSPLSLLVVGVLHLIAPPCLASAALSRPRALEGWEN